MLWEKKYNYSAFTFLEKLSGRCNGKEGNFLGRQMLSRRLFRHKGNGGGNEKETDKGN